MESHHQDVSASGELPVEHPLQERDTPCSNKLEELFPGETMEHDEDPNLRWLSIFVEDCLSSTPTPHLSPPPPQQQQQQPPQKKKPKPTTTSSSISTSIPVKPRTKRKRAATTILAYPPLLHQPHWLAESELLLPKEDLLPTSSPPPAQRAAAQQALPPKRCSHCQSQKTPQWREGPEGPKTLCNACGVRFKKGRLLPEYRPAKSPTFQSCKHSNSHKKVMEMRMMAAAALLLCPKAPPRKGRQ